ncbi:peptidoglycan DD-metalloendopeptidase family protein [Siminovitchia sediminis]|uniref:Peptidoglycan DD-metalloendopeptidase family protein n=1 Tax=Siminovitchia sediminis TaxID=1274353 RepID=A0ABW4KJK7_9BACI
MAPQGFYKVRESAKENMDSILRSIGQALKTKIALWIGGMLGFSGFVFIAVFFLLFLLIVGIAAGSSNNESSPSGGGFSCSQTGEVDIGKWDTVFKGAGKLAGSQETIISLSGEKGIDPVLFAAVALHETGFGTSNAVVNKNNPGGLMDPKTGSSRLYHFSTLEEGLGAMAKTLYNRIIRDGLNTIDKLGNVYAPIGAANDPTGLNKHWVPNVTTIATKLGGFTMNCEDVGPVEVIGDKAWPVPHTKNITSGYGPRSGGLHKGIDIAGGNDSGKAIVAFMDGRVVVSTFGQRGSGYGGYGNVVVVDHGNGMRTLYGHMLEKGIPEGTEVKAGEVVGKIGNTGDSRGAHLHFEIRINNKQVDPMPYIKELLGKK